VLSAPEDYAGEAAWYRQLLQDGCAHPPVTVLELGSGGGNNASHLKAHFQLTLLDLSPEMLAVSQRLNPECEHIQGDMRTARLGRQFDAVFVHDAVCYLTSEDDLRRAMETAFVHLHPGGVALFCPDVTRERFRASTDHGGHDEDGRAMRYLEWTWDPDPADTSYRVDFAYLLRDEAGTITAEYDSHIFGLFAEADWLRLLAEVGFQPAIVTSDLPDFADGIGGLVFLGTKPAARDQAATLTTGARGPDPAAADLWQQVLQPVGMAILETALPGYLLPRRWFASKARTMAGAHIADMVPVDGLAYLTLVHVTYTAGEPETYVVPLAVAGGGEAEAWLRETPMAVVARVEGAEAERLLYDAVWNTTFCQRLLDIVGEERTLTGQAGAVTSMATSAYPALRGDPAQPLTPHLLGVEQSNTNIRFDRQLLMKLFRRLEPGINPDLEIGTFLTERAHFAYVPPVAGALLYEPGEAGGEPATLAIVQGFVPNRGDAWRYALDSLAEYLARADAPVALPAGSLLARAGSPIPAEAGQRIGPFLESARLLGQRTAELHLALASDPDDPAFAPEPFTAADRRHLHREMERLTTRVMGLLRAGAAGLPAAALPDAATVLEQEKAILRQFDALLAGEISALRIRIHGDYHLGQVLVAGDDFMIIDFEGEPARPLRERREKRFALQDVAGMLRSFHYAAYAAYFDALNQGEGDPALLENWARYWHLWVSAAYLQTYLEVAEGAVFLPRSPEELAALLNAFLLEKAVYELGYELNNRPGWVRIPLQGILRTAGDVL
jgi:trehalose synthase-fused probable maltokinase